MSHEISGKGEGALLDQWGWGNGLREIDGRGNVGQVREEIDSMRS